MSEQTEKRFRLLARCQVNGAVQEPGYEFILKEGERGPHRTETRGHDRLDVDGDNRRIRGDYVDIPLYEEIA